MMIHSRKYFEILGHLDGVAPKRYDERQRWMAAYMRIRRLAKKHHRLAEMDCNGEGYINGQRYYGGTIDDWAKRQYGASVRSSYAADSEDSIFALESDKIEKKIEGLAESIGLFVFFQGDPRGGTVTLYADKNKHQYVELLD